jgi:lactate dehydrogenase-like 2-hydroxyacid dehydrogenase
VVSVYGVGTDAVNLAHARDNRIRVTNTPDVLSDDVADMAIGLLLASGTADSRMEMPSSASGQWGKTPMPLVTRVTGKRVGVVGMGRIGQAIARRAAGFDCEIRYFSRNPQPQVSYVFERDLTALAGWCEVPRRLSCPAATRRRTSSTPRFSQALGPDGILVNVSRGSTVDEAALIEALQKRTIKAAGLDVFYNEPDIDERFFDLDNVVLQPHHGSGTVETRKAMGQLVRDNLAAHFSGQPLPTPVV